MNSICDFLNHICKEIPMFSYVQLCYRNREKTFNIRTRSCAYLKKCMRLSHTLFIKCDIAEKFNVNRSMQCQSIDFLFQYSGKWDMHFSWFSALCLSRANSLKFFLSIDFIWKNNNACSWRAQTTHGSCHLEFTAKSKRMDFTSIKR